MAPMMGSNSGLASDERDPAMLSQIYLGKDYAAKREIDLHRHATFSCGMGRFLARLMRVLRSRG